MTGACLVASFALCGVASAQVTLNFGEPGLTPGFGPDPHFPGSPKGTEITNQFQSVGATFTMNAFAAAYVGSSSFVTGTNLLGWDNFLAINTIPPYGSNSAVVNIIFNDPNNVSTPGTVDGGSISFKISDINPVPSQRVAVRTYTLDDQLVEELFLTQFQDVFLFSIGTVHRVELTDNGSDGFVVDDFSYGAVTVVPEPATAAVLAPMAVWLLARRRR